MLHLVKRFTAEPGDGPPQPYAVPISYQHSICRSAQLVEALDMFRLHPQMRMLPVIDEDLRPVGAVLEQDMRLILFNPYGHALLKNPSYGARLDSHIRASPTVDVSAPTQSLIDTFASVKGHCEGLIVTRERRYYGVISNAVLLQLAATREIEIARDKARRFQSLQEASDRFRSDANVLAATLVAIAVEL